MTVTIFSFEGMHRVGGVARLCVELGAALRRAGHEVDYPLDAPAFADRGGPVVTQRQTPPLRHLVRALRSLRAARNHGPVICSQWYPEGVLALLAGVRPLVTLAHGSELMPSRARWRRRLWHWLRGRVLTASGTIVCSSAYTRDLALAAYPSCHAVALPLAVDETVYAPGDRADARRRFELAPEQRVIASVSRLYAYKGYETVFRSLAALPEDVRSRFVYLVAGTGPDRAALAALASDLGVASVVRWLGYVPDGDLPDVYRAANLFVLCPRENASTQAVEGFGLVFLEAQACATPVVGTRTGGVPDAIRPGDGGWLIEQDDVGALARLLEELHADPDAFRRMGVAGRCRVEREGTWDAYVERFIRITRLDVDKGVGGADRR